MNPLALCGALLACLQAGGTDPQHVQSVVVGTSPQVIEARVDIATDATIRTVHACGVQAAAKLERGDELTCTFRRLP